MTQPDLTSTDPDGSAAVTDADTAPKPKTIESLLESLAQEDRDFVLGQLSSARQDAAKYRTENKALKPLADKAKQLEDAQKTAEQRAQEAADNAQAQTARFRNRAVTAEVKSLAAGKFTDPDDALAFIDPAKYATDDGDIDTAAIEKDLTDLLQRKPHLAAAAGKTGVAHDPTQGSTAGSPGKPATPGQVFENWWRANSR